MPGIYSFIKNPTLNLLEVSGQLIQGIEKAVALYYDYEEQRIICKEIKKPSADNKHINNFAINNYEELELLRTKKFAFKWTSTNSLPFELQKNRKIQLDIFDEFENNVLCVAFPNRVDNKSDLIFLYLNSHQGSFGVSEANKKLSTELKSVIGTTVYNCFKIYLDRQKKDSETLVSINKKINAIQKENNRLKSDFENLKESYRQSILEMCYQHLEKLSAQLSVNFDLSNDAIHKLEQFRGNADILMESLTQSAILAVNMHFGNVEQTIVLKAWDIQLNEQEKTVETIYEDGLQERYYNTYNLLEKLENAAQVVINNRKKLTGENVGNACPKPITAPAVSDSLSKHKKKIINLMGKYPDRWLIIRNEFRPIRNILESSKTG